MGKHGLTILPYEFTLKYRKATVGVREDTENGLFYILQEGKRTYFPKSVKKPDRYYMGSIMEQDEESPHRYVKSYDELSGKTLLDIGAAEGNFSLSVIEKVDHVYLFECDPQWIEALNATFRPWKHKVTIVQKYVGDKNGEGMVSIDEFLKDKNKSNLFLKMDIEGAEIAALKGASETLKNEDLSFSICTYHRNTDANDIAEIFLHHNFRYEFTDGMLFCGNKFRKGIIRSISK